MTEALPINAEGLLWGQEPRFRDVYDTTCRTFHGAIDDTSGKKVVSLRGRRARFGPSASSKVQTGFMSAAFWIIVAVIAVGTVAAGLVRMRVWLQRPVPPEVIEAAHRDDKDEDGT